MTLCDVLSEAELWVGEMRPVRAGPRRLVVVRTERGVHAYEDRCPHLGVPLSRGTLEQNIITCSAHHFQFDAETGLGINPRNVRLVAARVECQDGKISIDDGASDAVLPEAALGSEEP